MKPETITTLFNQYNFSDSDKRSIKKELNDSRWSPKRVAKVVGWILENIEVRSRPTLGQIKQYLRELPNEEQAQYQPNNSYIHVSRADKQANQVIFSMYGKVMGAKTHKIALAAIREGLDKLSEFNYDLPQEERNNIAALHNRIEYLDKNDIPRVGQMKSSKQLAQEAFRKKQEMQAELANKTVHG